MITKLGKLSAEDLKRGQARFLPIRGLSVNPHAYSRQETEQAYLAYWQVMGEFAERYEMDDTTEWCWSEYTGELYLKED